VTQEGGEHEAPELITIRRFGDMSEALAAQGCLDSAGIASLLADANIARVEWPISRGIRLQVAKDDAETASALLKQTVADNFERLG
jgi:hypothetical protein